MPDINLAIAAKALLTGAAVGVIFALFRLPVPAPGVLEGVLGVVGLWAGFTLVAVLGWMK